jgi:hypothetical protein
MSEANETMPIDPNIIYACLANAASVYTCQTSNCECGRGAETLSRINLLLDEAGVNAANGRAFAHGVCAVTAIYAPAAAHISIAEGKNAAVLVVEALRRAGDITDFDIETVCDRFRNRLKESGAIIRAATAKALQVVKQTFGRFPVTPGSQRLDN